MGRKLVFEGFCKARGPDVRKPRTVDDFALGKGPGRAWGLDKTHILLQNVRFVEARRDFANPGFPGALYI